MGGPIQPPGHVQTLVRLIDYADESAGRRSTRRAGRSTRTGRSISKRAPSPELREGLIALGHRMESVPDSYMDFGAGQFIVRTEDGYIAASDPRRDGQAAGF